jgi:hypothetical protein
MAEEHFLLESGFTPGVTRVTIQFEVLHMSNRLSTALVLRAAEVEGSRQLMGNKMVTQPLSGSRWLVVLPTRASRTPKDRLNCSLKNNRIFFILIIFSDIIIILYKYNSFM